MNPMSTENLPAEQKTQLPEGTVTVLFTDLVDSTLLNQQLGDEAAHALSQSLDRSSTEIVALHRGIVVKGLGDGLMVAFQSARRAVACAHDLQVALRRWNRENPGQLAQMRIGLHTGEVIEDSGDLHGETVIIAKRIESVAPPGGILASDTVFGVLGTARDALIDRGEFELKGIATPWRLYEVPVVDEEESTEAVAAGGLTPYVGRLQERAILKDLIDRTSHGDGGTLFIAGEAGLGKSRFIKESVLAAATSGILVLDGHCLEGDASVPYQPVVDQLEQLSRQWDAELLRSVLGDDAPEVAKVIPNLRKIFPEIGESAVLSPDQERRFLLNGVGEFFRRVAGNTPLVLVFEDLDYADESTLTLLANLSQIAKACPLLLIGTYRPAAVVASHPFAKVLTDLNRRRLTAEIRLPALSENEVEEFVAGLAGSTPPKELVTLIYGETEGNPFFVEELFAHLFERGDLFDDAGNWRPGIDIADTEVPRNVRLLIEQRLAQISDNARTALTAAATIGRLTQFEVLLEVVDLGEDDLFDSLEEAESANLISGENAAGFVHYRFVHEQFRQTLLANLSALRRQRLHGKIAAALIAHYGDNADDHATDIAYHVVRGGSGADRDQARHFLTLAANAALTAVAPEEAIRHLDAALGFVDSDDARATLLVMKARALRSIPDLDAAFADLAEALRISSESERDYILEQRAQLNLDLYNGRAASADLDVVVAHARAAGDQLRELPALIALARAHYVRSLDEPDYTTIARDTYGAAIDLAESLGNREAMVEGLTKTVHFTDYFLDYGPTAKANAEKALAIARDISDASLIVEAEVANLRFISGDAAIDRAIEIRTRLEGLRDPVRLKEHHYWLMWGFYRRARFVECVDSCDRGIALAQQLGSPPVQYGSIKAHALVAMGAFDQVDAALSQEVTDEDHPFGQAHHGFAKTMYLAAIDAPGPGLPTALAAMKLGAETMRIWLQSGVQNYAVIMAARSGDQTGTELAQIEAIAASSKIPLSPQAVSERQLANGDAAAAYETLAGYVSAVRGYDDPLSFPSVIETLGRISLALERYDESLALADEGLLVTEKTGQLPLSWRLHALRSRALEGLGRHDESSAASTVAQQEFSILSARIDDVVLQGWFTRSPSVVW